MAFRNIAFSNMIRLGSQNNAGYVRIRSSDPIDQPEINFQHFGVGADSDIGAMMDALLGSAGCLPMFPSPSARLSPQSRRVLLVFRPMDTAKTPHRISRGLPIRSLVTTPLVRAPLGEMEIPWLSWTPRLRVRGVDGLRVVDASVFPKIFGAFPVVSTTMVGQKGSEAVLEDKDDW
jgi:choline dehydrogenase